MPADLQLWVVNVMARGHAVPIRGIDQSQTEILAPGVRQRLFVALTLIAAVLLVGTAGYMLIEGWSIADSFYMTLISISTVGYAEVHPLDIPGRVFTGFIIIGGFSVLAYNASVLASSIIEHELPGRAHERRLRNAVLKMRNHVIVCGYGRVGGEIARELAAEGVPLIFIEIDPGRVNQCLSNGLLCIAADATEDDALVQAGVERAHALVAALDDDTQNVFITLSARVLNPDLLIIARASARHTENKLMLAGASHVVSPYAIAGRRIAGVVVRPGVVQFLDTVLSAGGLAYVMDEIIIGADSELVGRSLQVANVRQRTGAMVLAVNHAGEATVTNPPPEFTLGAGDSMIVIGTPSQLVALAHLAEDNQVELDLRRQG